MRFMCRKQVRTMALGLLVLLLSGCGAQTVEPAKILAEEVKITSNNLKTAQVQSGDLRREHTMSADVVHAKKTHVRLQADGAMFVEHKVNIGQEVKRGDVLSVFRKQGDNVRLTEIRYELEELDTSRQDGLEDRAEQMEELQEQIDLYLPDSNGSNDVASNLQLEILEMQMEKLQLEQEQFLLRLDEQERLLKEERRKLLEAEEELIVTAPVDGIVETVQYMMPGRECSRGDVVVVLYDPTQLMLVADGGILGQFRMGQPVEIQAGRFNDVMTLPGHVVAADNVLPTDLRCGKSYIVLDGALSQEIISGAQIMSAMQISASVKVSSVEVDLRNVQIVPRDAVQYDNTKAYVELVDGTSTSLRYVQAGPNDKEKIMILAGLEQGDTVITK